MSPDDPRHGTVAGYSAHRRAKQETCQPCRDALARDFNHRQMYGPKSRSPIGVQRRIQALQRLGWTLGEIAERAGYADLENVWQMLGRESVTHDTHKRVAAAYDAMCMTIPPPRPQRQRVVNNAIRKGYFPPLAWNDIDNKDERPNLHGRRTYAQGELADEWDFLRRSGCTLAQAATRLGVSVDAIEKAVSRSRVEDVA